ncbi:MAG TPA: efflux RND transporter periplasmic adaptor subunit [Dinghuibacter sp.]|jgi:RND family efflux transporter MFP subunit|uniref:efflux RND transporter periplasmic adaptor subunit n=1 Tax=Dinghuibacter sp. TaxID=2024697 RepID=UPI002BD295BA|nr:efflux RND transporter periplasmic adaptor subunit [Dinghuibacter sp.]HTJ11585.1 efflux RND transporter periplasmic adaptor subunit [Dinghuibacter sp.]
MNTVRSIVWLALAAIAVESCNPAASETPVAPAAIRPSFRFMSLYAHPSGSQVRLPGLLLPFESVQIFPKVNGFVKSVRVDRGSEVSGSAVLLELEAPEMEDKIASAKLSYVQAHAGYLASKDKYDRMRVISRTPGTVSDYDLEAARDKMTADSALAEGAMAEYKAQQDLYRYLTVTAPFAGVISERNVHPGALVGPGVQGAKPMLVLQRQDLLRLLVNIPEQYTAQLSRTGKVHFTVNALPGQEFTAAISRASGALNDAYRSEAIELDVPNRGGVFKPGMYAEVELPVSGNARAFMVPKASVVTTTEHKYVVLNQDGKARWIDVTLGNDHGDSTEVFGDLRAGDGLLLHADYTINEGSIISNHQ